MFKVHVIIGVIGILLTTSAYTESAQKDGFSPVSSVLKNTTNRMIFSRSVGGDLGIYHFDPSTNVVDLRVKPSVSGRGEYEAAVSPDGRQIAFTTYRFGGWKVATADISGENVKRVTLDPHYAYDPAWSPNGKQLMYRRIVPNGSAYFRGQADIFRINIDGSDNQNVTQSLDSGERKPIYSPDGATVIFDSWLDEDEGKFRLMSMDLSSGQQKIVGKGSNAMIAPSWSPDGQKIAHLRGDDDGYVDVWIMRPDGTNALNLTQSKKRGFEKAAGKIQHWQYDTHWSPDGKFVSFVANYAEAENIDIYVTDVLGQHVARLTTHKEPDIHPFWYQPNTP